MKGLTGAALRSPLLYLAGLLVVAVAYFSAANEFFGELENFEGIAAGAAVPGIVAVGVTLALAAGAIDFSVAGNIAFAGVLVAWLQQHVGWGLALVLTLVAATGVGLFNGVVVTRFGANPFIATLAVAGSLRGLCFIIAGSSAGIFIDSGPLITIGQSSVAEVPITLLVLIAVSAAGLVVLRWAPFGRRLLAVGGNPEAARLAGMPVARLQLAGYVLSALSAGLAGILLAGRTGAGLPQAATGQELLIFSAVILGGTSLWGGRASVVGSVLAILLVNVLYNGLTLEQVSPYWQTMIQGALLIVAVWLVQQRREGCFVGFGAPRLRVAREAESA